MATTHFLQFGPLPDSAFENETAVREAAQIIQSTSTPRDFLFGTIFGETSTVQVTSEGHTTLDPSNKVDSFWSSPTTSYSVTFPQSLFRPNGPAQGKVVEYVQHFFPVLKATPEFQNRIEQDFLNFNKGFSKGGVEGRLGWNFGWTTEDVDHPNINGEKAKSFVIVVGWESMEAFERAIQREIFKEVIPILIAWGAPYKMVRVGVWLS